MADFNQLLSQLRSAYEEVCARNVMLEHQLHQQHGHGAVPVECKPELEIHGSVHGLVDPCSPIDFPMPGDSPAPQPPRKTPSALMPAAYSSSIKTISSGNDAYGDSAGGSACAGVWEKLRLAEEKLSSIRKEIAQLESEKAAASQSQNVHPEWPTGADAQLEAETGAASQSQIENPEGTTDSYPDTGGESDCESTGEPSSSFRGLSSPPIGNEENRTKNFMSDASMRSVDVWRKLRRSTSSSTMSPNRYDFTKSVTYEVSMMFVIMLNAAYIGWAIQHALTKTDNADDTYYGYFMFLGIYLFDLAARLTFEGTHFFRGHESYWNFFDTCVVLIMIIELVLEVYYKGVAALSLFRALRLFRFVKVVKYFFEFSREFRMLLYSSQHSARAFFWFIVLFVFIVYFVAIIMTQGALSSCQHDGVLVDTDPVCELFGSLDRAVINLYLAVFGGIAWGELEAVTEALGLVFPLVIILYVSFMHMILLNVITGIVLEIYRNTAETEKHTMIGDTLRQKHDYIKKMQDIFAAIDLNSSGGISWDEFQHALDDQRMCAMLEKLEIEVHDANQLFRMMDRDETGAIDVDEFIFGLMKVKGEAKAVDVLKLHIECEWMMHQIRAIRHSVDKMSGSPRKASSYVVPITMREAPSSSLQTGRASSPRASLTTPTQLYPEFSMHRSMQATDTSMVAPPLGDGQLPCRIERVEDRAVTLRDLARIVARINRACETEGWKETGCAEQDTKRLRPEGVNLYHFNWHCICPATAPAGVELRGLTLPHYGTEGYQIVQMDANNVCLAEGISRGIAAAGVLSVHLTKGRFQTLLEAADSNVSIDGVDIQVGVADEITVTESLSYKEIINPMPTKAVWFCSHWWGEPVLDFVEACVAHSRLRKLSDDAAYWVCAYANRQHDIQDVMRSDPEASSFRVSMNAAKGVLLVLDSKATPFRRIWCDFELYHTLSDEKPLDIVTIAWQGSKRGPHLLSQTRLPGETLFTKARREVGFPLDLLVSGMHAHLEDGEASNEKDKGRILECMARKQIRTPRDTETDLENALELANGMLHSYLALSAWPQAVKKACVQDIDSQSPGTLCLPEIVARASHMQYFNLSLAHITELENADLELISRSFQNNLKGISLCFEGCANITDAGLTSLVQTLPANLQELSLDCVGCRRVSDAGLKSLAKRLPKGLKKLDLFFATCPLIGIDGIIALENRIPSGLRHFQGRFEGTQVNCKFDSVRDMAKFLASVRRPQHTGVAGAMVAALGRRQL